MGIKVKNNAFSTLASGINNSVTSLSVASGEGSRFPALASGDYFYATIVEGTTVEIIKCTARSTDALTIVRAQDGSSASAFSAGAKIEVRWNESQVKEYAGHAVEQPDGISGTTLTFDCSLGESILADLNSASGTIVTFAITNAVNGKTYVVRILQDSSSAIAITFANWTDLEWLTDSQTTIGTALGKKSILTLYYDGSKYIGNLSKPTV